MKDLQKYLQTLQEKSDINFNIIDENGEILHEGIQNKDRSKITQCSLKLRDNYFKLQVDKEKDESLQLLKFIIKEKINQYYSMHKQWLSDLLSGKEISEEVIKRKNINIEGSNILVIQIDENKKETLEFLKEIYSEQDITMVIFEEYIVILGIFEDVEEHVSSIMGSIEQGLYKKCYISYTNSIHEFKHIKKSFNFCKEALMLRERFASRDKIINPNKFLVENLIYKMDNRMKAKIKIESKQNFAGFDEEMIQTIDEFINCDLNISEAAKRLYIHRNTLIYRLEKVKKETGFDIKNFKEAMLFNVNYLIWKEKSI